MPIADQHPVYIAVILAILGFLIGFSKGGFSGLGALLTPLLALVLPVASAVGVLLPMLMVGDVFAVSMYWKEWDSDLVQRMLPAGIVGAFAGTALLAWLPPDGLRITLGIFVLVLVVYRFLSDRVQSLQFKPRPWHAPAAGFLAGIASGMFNYGGPAINSYLLLQKLKARPFIATGAIYFAILNIIKVPGFLFTGVLNVQLLFSLWWVFPFIPLGIWIARRMLTRLSSSAFEWMIVVLLIFSSVWLLR
jgi:uncharacterized membrane protein YfcA